MRHRRELESRLERYRHDHVTEHRHHAEKQAGERIISHPGVALTNQREVHRQAEDQQQRIRHDAAGHRMPSMEGPPRRGPWPTARTSARAPARRRAAPRRPPQAIASLGGRRLDRGVAARHRLAGKPRIAGVLVRSRTLAWVSLGEAEYPKGSQGLWFGGGVTRPSSVDVRRLDGGVVDHEVVAHPLEDAAAELCRPLARTRDRRAVHRVARDERRLRRRQFGGGPVEEGVRRLSRPAAQARTRRARRACRSVGPASTWTSAGSWSRI